MKYVSITVLSLLVAACGSQQRPMDEPDFSAEPYTAPEDQPRQGEVDSLISQAKLEIKRRDFDEARVKLHQVFRRDRWNPEANTLYQDLQISRDMGDALYQEYLDLYEANKQRGDALWFHLRPLLIKRGIKACEVEKHPELTEEQRNLIAELEKQEAELGGSEEVRARRELARIDEILSVDPMRWNLILRRAQLAPDDTRKRYRELSEENPASGDTLYLYAMAVCGAESNSNELDILRSGWILDLPGMYLRLGIAQFAHWTAYACRAATGGNRPPRRGAIYDEHVGFLNLALNFYSIAARSTPDESHATEISALYALAKECKRPLEDLSQRK